MIEYDDKNVYDFDHHIARCDNRDDDALQFILLTGKCILRVLRATL